MPYDWRAAKALTDSLNMAGTALPANMPQEHWRSWLQLMHLAMVSLPPTCLQAAMSYTLVQICKMTLTVPSSTPVPDVAMKQASALLQTCYYLIMAYLIVVQCRCCGGVWASTQSHMLSTSQDTPVQVENPWLCMLQWQVIATCASRSTNT